MITNPVPPSAGGNTAPTLATDLAPKLHAAAYEDDIPEISGGGGEGGGGDDSPIGGGLAAMQEMSAYYQSSGGGHYCHYSNHQQQHQQQQAYSWHQQPADYGYYNQYYGQGYGQHHHQLYQQQEQWLQQQQHQQHQNQLVLPPGPSPTGKGPAYIVNLMRHVILNELASLLGSVFRYLYSFVYCSCSFQIFVILCMHILHIDLALL
jgi:hypothetical protein